MRPAPVLAKFAAIAPEAEAGALIGTSGPVDGLAWMDRTSIISVSWRVQNVVPDDDDMNPPLDGTDSDQDESGRAATVEAR